MLSDIGRTAHTRGAMSKKSTPPTASSRSTDADIDNAIRKIYLAYGPDLSAFARDVEMRSGNERHESTDKSHGAKAQKRR